MGRVLIVANKTAAWPHIRERVEQIVETDPGAEIRLLVPATPTGANARLAAHEQLRAGLAALTGIDRVTGVVGDEQPLQAVEDEIAREPVDAILVSTLPAGVSRWLRMDLPHRLRRRFGVRVEHLEGAGIEGEAVGGAIRPVRVLVVEDDAYDIELTMLALERAPVETEVRVARHGADALSHVRNVRTGSFDLVLLDLKMPVLDGLSFLEAAREFDGLHATMVAVVTTSNRDADRDRAHELGADAYIVKDQDFDVFRHAIDGLLLEAAVHR